MKRAEARHHLKAERGVKLPPKSRGFQAFLNRLSKDEDEDRAGPSCPFPKEMGDEGPIVDLN